MSEITLDISLIKAALSKSLRVGLFFKQDDIIVEYHFSKDPRDKMNKEFSIVCVMCSSTNGDSLKLTGTFMNNETFENIVKGNEEYKEYKLYEAKLFPLDWYPCFETDAETRIAKVKQTIPSLYSVAKQIKAADRIVEEQKIKQIVEDKKRIEEGVRRNMENLSSRREARFNKGMVSSRDTSDAYNTCKIRPSSLGPGVKF